MTPEALSLFRALYYNVGGFQDSYIGYTKAVANAFSSNKYVVGYDPLNEPSPASKGSVWDTIK